MSELRENIARELFYVDWDREHIIHLVDSGNWEDCEAHIKEIYYKEADAIISLTVKEIRGVENPYPSSLRDIGIFTQKPDELIAKYHAFENCRQAIIARLEAK